MNYLTDRGYEFNSSIIEYDIKHWNIILMKYYNLYPDIKKLDRLDAMEKGKREKEVGLMQRADPELAKKLERAFNDIVTEFMQVNNLSKEDDVISIKKDAVFVVNKPVLKTEFGPVNFIPKNHYHAFIAIERLEFYIAKDHIDVKGIGDNLYLHNNGMLAVIDSLVNVIENEDTAALNAFLISLCEMYKTKNLDITCYREFNSKSMYKCNMEDKEMYLENIGYDYLDKYCDISYNYVNVILPLVRLFL